MNMKKHLLISLLSFFLTAASSSLIAQTQAGKTVKSTGKQMVNPRDPVLNFEHVWKTLDRNYGQFPIKHVDWEALYRVYRPMVSETTTDQDLWDILLRMMGHLNDAHLCLADGTRRVGGSRNEGLVNEIFSAKLLKTKYLKKGLREELGGSFCSGWLSDGVAYLQVADLKDNLEQIALTIDSLMTEFAQARAMIVDVRNNPGGASRAVDIVAGRFADRRRHYGTQRTRYGLGHDEFLPPEYRYVEPSGPLQFTGPTVLLTDRFSASAAEGFILAMRVLPHVTVLGDVTEGALSAQFPDRMPNGWTLWVAFRETRDHEGGCWDGVGIPPDLCLVNKAADIEAGRDAVLEFAMTYLEKGAPTPQEDAASLKDVKQSLVAEYMKRVGEKKSEAAIALLDRERTADSDIFYFTPDEALQQAGPLLGRRLYPEAIGLLQACRDNAPQIAVSYAMLAQAYIGAGDVISAEAIMKAGEAVEPMLPWEGARIEQAKTALRKARLGSAAELYGRALAEGGISFADKKLKKLMKKRPAGPVFDEAEFNALGYRLLAQKQTEGALHVFELAVKLFPGSWNAWDSLGEVEAQAGYTRRAMASYRKSLELNPGNKNGREKLEKLNSK